MSKGGKTGEATDFSGANRFGDYVFWRSIVDHAREDDAIRTVVIISHDAKRDWVHKPQKYVGYGSKPLNNDKKEDERSEKRRGGKEWVSTCRDRWSPDI